MRDRSHNKTKTAEYLTYQNVQMLLTVSYSRNILGVLSIAEFVSSID